MTSTTTDSTKQASANAGSQPSAYYMPYIPDQNPNMAGFNTMPSSGGYGLGNFPQHPNYPATGNTTVMVTQPIIMGSPEGPSTTCALVMSTLSVIFCSFCFGTLGIILAWKARLQVLDKKIAHARHSIKIAWLFVFLALVFGVLMWIAFGFYVYLLSIVHTIK